MSPRTSQAARTTGSTGARRTFPISNRVSARGRRTRSGIASTSWCRTLVLQRAEPAGAGGAGTFAAGGRPLRGTPRRPGLPPPDAVEDLGGPPRAAVGHLEDRGIGVGLDRRDRPGLRARWDAGLVRRAEPRLCLGRESGPAATGTPETTGVCRPPGRRRHAGRPHPIAYAPPDRAATDPVESVTARHRADCRLHRHVWVMSAKSGARAGRGAFPNQSRASGRRRSAVGV